jgi:hypothetical protein
MSLPELTRDGELPIGVHKASLEEVLERFGQGSIQRGIVRGRLERVYRTVQDTGELARLVVFGSFVTGKVEPNDVDVSMIMEDTFDASKIRGQAALLFDHSAAEANFGATIFWVRRSTALGGEQAWIEEWQVKRGGGRRGIVEIVEEGR